jgi:hypothetical protein
VKAFFATTKAMASSPVCERVTPAARQIANDHHDYMLAFFYCQDEKALGMK